MNNFRIFQEKAGVISKEPIWVCISEGYLYNGDTIEELIETLNNSWKNDRHLVGDESRFFI